MGKDKQSSEVLRHIMEDSDDGRPLNRLGTIYKINMSYLKIVSVMMSGKFPVFWLLFVDIELKINCGKRYIEI